MTVGAMETRRSKGNQKIQDRLGQCVFTRVYMLLDREFHLEISHGRIVSSHMEIMMQKQKYSWRNELLREIYKFQ